MPQVANKDDHPPIKTQNRANTYCQIVLVVSVIVIFGWIFNIEFIKSIDSTWASMKVNTALMFILCALSINLQEKWPHSRSAQVIARIVSICLMTFASANLMQYFYKVDLGIDQIFVYDTIHSKFVTKPGRTSLPASLCFFLISFCTIIGRTSKKWLVHLSQTLSGSVSFLTFCAFLTYVFRLQLADSHFFSTAMAIHTILNFFLLSLAIFQFHPESPMMEFWNDKTTSGIIGKRLAVAVIVLPILDSVFLKYAEQQQLFKNGTSQSDSNFLFFITTLSLCSLLFLIFWPSFLTLKNIEKNLDENRLLKSTILDSSLDGMITMDNRGKILDINLSAQKIFGLSHQEALGKDLADTIMPARFRESHRLGLQNQLSSNAGRILGKRLELIGLRSDGTEFPVEVSIARIDFNEVAIFIGFIRDITDQVRAKSEISLQSKRIESIIEHIVDGVITIDESFKIKTWNNAAKKIFGYKESEVIGQNVNMLMPDPYRIEHDSYVENYIRTGVKKIIGSGREVVGRRKDGSVFPMDLAVSEFIIGKERFFTGIVRDITDRKQSAENLLQAKQAAESANASKSAFLANMSHEIRTPLGVILGFVDLISESKHASSEDRLFLDTIKRNGSLLSKLVDDILDLAKVEAGKIEITKEPIELDQILKDLETTFKVKTQTKNLQFSINKGLNVPQRIHSDQLRLRQILLNIIGNAIRFTEHGYIELKVELTEHESEKPLLSFFVKDSGKGISPDGISNLFKPFSQADSTTVRNFGGTGLGLVLSKNLAHLLGGDLSLIATAIGHGSTFKLTIDPEIKMDADKSNASTSNDQTEIDFENFTIDHLNVLLVEDTPDFQFLTGLILKKFGASVTVANNGDEALKILQTQSFDVIIMDLQMPVMDGYQATATLRRLKNKTPIIALSAHAMKEERQKCLNAGFDEYLSKPVNFQTLLNCIKRFAKKG